jgi:hypothetical protein
MQLCECGCGRPTPISPYTRRSDGRLRGHPVRFIRGHAGGPAARSIESGWVEEDCGYETACWIWQRGRTRDGYAHARHDGRVRRVHVLTWEAGKYRTAWRQLPRAGADSAAGAAAEARGTERRAPVGLSRRGRAPVCCGACTSTPRRSCSRASPSTCRGSCRPTRPATRRTSSTRTASPTAAPPDARSRPGSAGSTGTSRRCRS